MTRTHLKNAFSRDTNQFRLRQGADDEAVPFGTARRSDDAIGRNWPYPLGFLRFFSPASLLLVNGALAPLSLSRLADRRKSLRTRLERIFEMGSRQIFVKLIPLYQKIFSPDHNIFFETGFYRCRFYPSCSDYSISVFRQYGLSKGIVLSLKRILRCNPWNAGGYDPV